MSGKTFLYTGGYTMPTKLGSGETVDPGCPGIICFSWDEEQGTLTRLHTTREGADNTTWVMIDPKGMTLYAVNEMKQFGDAEGGAVAAYRIDPENGKITYIGRQVSAGTDPCHLTMAADGKYVICANYSGGSFGSFPVREDGSLAPLACLLRHVGSGPDSSRQEMPHPHQILHAPGEAGDTCVYIADLGLDQLVCYDVDPGTGWLQPSKRPPVCAKPGQGSRHACFNADGTRLYVITEMACEVNVYRYDPATGENELLQIISAMGTRVSENDQECLGAEIHIGPTGKQLYASVRRSNHIAVFDIGQDGTLTLKQTIRSGGEIPRDFIISPGGNYLLAGNQDTGNIVIFRIDPADGTLSVHGECREAQGATVLALCCIG